MSFPLSSEDDLAKLNIPQLKLMCKERQIIGYSKLVKKNVIQKILDWQSQNKSLLLDPVLSTDEAAQVSTVNVIENNGTLGQAIEAPDRTILNDADGTKNSLSEVCLPLAEVSNACSTVETLGLATPLPSLRQQNTNTVTSQLGGSKTSTKNVSDNGSSAPATTTSTKISTKRKRDIGDSKTGNVTKKSRTLQTFVHPGFSVSMQDSPSMSPASTDRSILKAVHVPSDSGRISENLGIPLLNPKPSRFKALVLGTGKKTTVTPKPDVANPCHQRYLDFYVEDATPQMQRISLPPSMAQRKHVPRLSLLLSQVSFQDLKSCALVSRLFRYAAYMAAYHQLLRFFSGARLAKVLLVYPSNITDFWPYLRYRLKEKRERKSIYNASFLGRSIKDVYNISENLWTSPNDSKQVTIAIRFLLTRLFFWVSLGHGENMLQPQNGRSSIILDTQEIIPNEIWTVSVLPSSTITTFYVLEATCEVIGEEESAGLSSRSGKIRTDWEGYIAARRCLPSPPTDSVKRSLGLLEHLQWSNREEYSEGISKVWLSRIEKEGDIGRAKLEVAHRYVLACVVSNSVSGPRLTSNQMRQEFNGLPSGRESTSTKPNRINIYLPEHHYVESVHFTLSNGTKLHPALAIVQTPGREYYILKDNGMQVGCEEDGVAYIWMKLIGCTNLGCV